MCCTRHPQEMRIQTFQTLTDWSQPRIPSPQFISLTIQFLLVLLRKNNKALFRLRAFNGHFKNT
jgi:hypothetical protein